MYGSLSKGRERGQAWQLTRRIHTQVDVDGQPPARIGCKTHRMAGKTLSALLPDAASVIAFTQPASVPDIIIEQMGQQRALNMRLQQDTNQSRHGSDQRTLICLRQTAVYKLACPSCPLTDALPTLSGSIYCCRSTQGARVCVSAQHTMCCKKNGC